MSFWELPNEDKTAEEVDRFLTKQLPRLIAASGSRLTELKSPSFESLGGGSTENSAELKLTEKLNAPYAIRAIVYTMNRTHGVSPLILFKFYVKGEPVWKIRQELYINHDSFPKMKKSALCQFAEAWNTTQEELDWSEEDRIDLRKYDD